MMVNLPCLQGSRPNFLRPTCSYTECQLSFLTGSMPYGGYSCRLQLLFVFWLFTDLIGSVQHSFSGRYAVPPLSRSSDDRDSFSPSPSGSFPEPCSVPDVSATQQDSGILLFWSVRLRCCCLYILWIPDILQQFLRIIRFPCLQHRIDHTKQLTCDHDQWLHLLERISRPRCIVGMDPFIFFSMCHRWPGCLE